MRPRQPLYLAAGGDIVFQRYRENESGQTEAYEQNDSTAVLPAVETTDLALLLKAGIDPKRVDTKIIPSQSVVTDLSVPETNNNNQEEEA